MPFRLWSVLPDTATARVFELLWADEDDDYATHSSLSSVNKATRACVMTCVDRVSVSLDDLGDDGVASDLGDVVPNCKTMQLWLWDADTCIHQTDMSQRKFSQLTRLRRHNPTLWSNIRSMSIATNLTLGVYKDKSSVFKFLSTLPDLEELTICCRERGDILKLDLRCYKPTWQRLFARFHPDRWMSDAEKRDNAGRYPVSRHRSRAFLRMLASHMPESLTACDTNSGTGDDPHDTHDTLMNMSFPKVRELVVTTGSGSFMMTPTQPKPLFRNITRLVVVCDLKDTLERQEKLLCRLARWCPALKSLYFECSHHLRIQSDTVARILPHLSDWDDCDSASNRRRQWVESIWRVSGD